MDEGVRFSNQVDTAVSVNLPHLLASAMGSSLHKMVVSCRVDVSHGLRFSSRRSASVSLNEVKDLPTSVDPRGVFNV